MTGEDDGGDPRVSIPDSLLPTIQGIKEIAVNYSDGDIYGMLKECNMDSHETTEKLMYLDTFQVVKSKRKPRVMRDGGDDRYSYSYSDNYNGGRKLNSNLQRRPHKSSMPVPRRESSKSPAVGSSSDKIYYNGIKGDKDGTSRKTSSLGRVSVNHVSDSEPGPTPTSAPTNTLTAGLSDRKQGQSKIGNGVVPPSTSGSVLCPASDPVLVESLNIKNSPPVGTIKRETTKNQDVGQTQASGSVDVTSSSTQPQVNGCLKESSEDHCSNNTTSELDVKPRQSVIFPSHFHVPENFKNALYFGSFESNNEGSSDPSDPEASPVPQSSSPISGHNDYPDQSTHAPLNLTSSEENILSGADLRYDQSEQIMQPSNGSLLDYGSSLAPPSVQLQGLDIQAESSLLTTGTTPSPTQQTTAQPKLGSSQSSVPASPHMYSFFRPTYPSNYVYNPYYPGPLYLPQQNVHHQVPSNNGFPHQPSASDIYMSPPTAVSASGPKFPAFKTTHFGTPSVYGSSGSFPDGMRNELKENNLFSNLPPQGQVGHNSFSGMYHPSQGIPTQSLHQPQPSSAVSPSLRQQISWGKKL